MFKKAISAVVVVLCLLATTPLAAAERQSRERDGVFVRELTKILRAMKRVVLPAEEALVIPKP
jgi:hypothetical protein